MTWLWIIEYVIEKGHDAPPITTSLPAKILPDYLLYCLLGVFIAFFLLPIRVALLIRRQEFEAPLQFDLRWAFFRGLAGIEIQRESPGWLIRPLVCGIGLAGPRLRLRPGKSKPKKDAVAKPGGPEKLKKSAGELATQVRGLTDLLAAPGLGLVRRLPRAVSLHRLAVNGTFGLSNPASTGSLCGYLHAINGCNVAPLTLSMSPEFARSGLKGQISLALHIHHGYALFSLLRFACVVAYRYVARFAGSKMGRIRHSLHGIKPEKLR